MAARDSDRRPDEQVLFEARLGKWTSHHAEFFTKMRTLTEVRTQLLQAWWRTYMLLCIYVLRAIVATMRRKLAIESGSTYYARLVEEYHEYWRVAPIEPSAVWRRHVGPPPTAGSERNLKALQLALRNKCALVNHSAPRQECNPTFSKEEWVAFGAVDWKINDYTKSGDHYFVLIKCSIGDNKAARHIKRQQRRQWYKGNSTVAGADGSMLRCQRLVIMWPREEADANAVRAKREVARARAAAQRTARAQAAEQQTAGQRSRGRRRAREEFSETEEEEEEDGEEEQQEEEHHRGYGSSGSEHDDN